MATATADEKVAIGLAALELKATADSVRRRIQRGEIAGGMTGTRWYVSRNALDKMKAAAFSDAPARTAA